MCRMLLSVGNIKEKSIIEYLLQGIIDMALEKTGEQHEILKKMPEFKHDSGWGSAWVYNNEISLIKSPKPIFEEKEKLFSLTNYLLNSKWFLIHARKASPGYEVKTENVHPFVVDFKGTPVVFAHNGEVKKSFLETMPEPKNFVLTGTTDSERFFYYLLEKLESPKNINKPNVEIILNSIPETEYSGLNFFLATPEKVLVNVMHSKRPKYFTMKKTIVNGAIIISSEKFTIPNATWEEIPNHTLLELQVNNLP